MTQNQATKPNEFVYWDGLRAFNDQDLYKLSGGEFCLYVHLTFREDDNQHDIVRIITSGTEDQCSELMQRVNPNDDDGPVAVVLGEGVPEPVEIRVEMRESHRIEEHIRNARKGRHCEGNRLLTAEDIGWEVAPDSSSKRCLEFIFLFSGPDPVSKNKVIELDCPIQAMREMSESIGRLPVGTIIFTEEVQMLLSQRSPKTGLRPLQELEQEHQDRLSEIVVESYPTEKAVFFRAGVKNTLGQNILIVH